MLILDEATSNVDTQTEEKIQQAMRELMKGENLLRDRPQVVHHQKTRIIFWWCETGISWEQGNHESLLEKGGLYAKLYYSQFQ